MPDFRAIIVKGGVQQGITTTDTLVVGNKVDAESGQALSVGDVNATALSLSRPGVTTTVQGPLNLPSNAEFLGKVKGLPPVGPGQLLQFSGTLFQNSGYVPGVGEFSTPSAFGFFPVQNANFVFNPADIFGLNNTYRIRVAVLKGH